MKLIGHIGGMEERSEYVTRIVNEEISEYVTRSVMEI